MYIYTYIYIYIYIYIYGVFYQANTCRSLSASLALNLRSISTYLHTTAFWVSTPDAYRR